MPAAQDRNIVISTWTILKVLGILFGLFLLYLVRDILALLFAALFLAALMHPAARFLATKKIPKGITVLGFYIVLFGSAVLAFGLLVPPFLTQSAHLMDGVGRSWQVLADSANSLKEFSATYGLNDNIQAGVQSLQGQVTNAATGLFSTLTGIFGGIVGLLVVLVLAYYMVVQDESAKSAFYQIVPKEYQELASTILLRVEEKIGRWLLGQLALGLIVGVLYYIGLRIIGVESALVLAVFGGFTEFIPYLGPILGAIPVFLLALSQSPLIAAFSLIVIIVIQQVENNILVPKIMERAVGLNPLVSIIALLIGAKLFGLVGVILAIPVATATAVILSELYRSRNEKLVR
jgi:predicted PurR-regulated permease PerM